jgi:hypothetical protein
MSRELRLRRTSADARKRAPARGQNERGREGGRDPNNTCEQERYPSPAISGGIQHPERGEDKPAATSASVP